LFASDTPPDFSALRVAVVGDLICDHYVVTEPRGLSREAPVIVLRHRGEHVQAGGAANVARNLRALGAPTRVVGVLGRDARGREVLEILERDGVDVACVETIPGWTTPTKTRVVAAEPRRSLQQVLRLDREPDEPAPAAARERARAAIEELSRSLGALVISDYDYGLVDADLGRAAARAAQRGVVVVLDPRGTVEGFDGVTALTPNVAELAHFTGRHAGDLGDPRALAAAARALLEQIRVRYLLVTRGNDGMALYGDGLDPRGVAVEASGAGDVTDVTGAGDTAAAVFALALAAGVEAPRAMQLANAASGVVVMEHGAAVCTPGELAAALASAPAPVRIG
jgi:D-beta-D-heptose 7-phosphate kinase/D-beta-D-heptose 1-phosphate adenosyltransferase